MTCKECEKIDEKKELIYYFRWGIANIGIIACEQHAKEIIKVLREYKKKNSTI